MSDKNNTGRGVREAGFTLVELLVVVGIIAVLISILLPALQTARAASQKIACASNMRQVVIATQMYANENKGMIPIGRASNLRWVNYWFVDNSDTVTATNPSGPAFYMFGSLYAAGVMKDGRIAYCPTQKQRSHQYNTYETSSIYYNPWPPVILPPGPSQPRTRAGYSMRPDYYIAYDSAIGKTDFPRQKDLKGKTIISDLITHDTTINTGHRGGLNRALVDGSIATVPMTARSALTPAKTLRENLEDLTPVASSAANNKKRNDAVDAAFDAMDRN